MNSRPTKTKIPLTKKQIVQAILVWIAVGVTIYFGFFHENSLKGDAVPGSPRTNLLETAVLSQVPKSKEAAVKAALSAVLKKCNNISIYAQHGERLKAFYYPHGWERTPAHIDLEIDFTRESLKAMPQGLRDPQWGGHAEMGLSAGANPGLIMETPLPEWLCGYPVDEDILFSAARDWDMKKVFVPLPAVPPNSF